MFSKNLKNCFEMETDFSNITTKIYLNFQSPKFDESKRHFHQKVDHTVHIRRDIHIGCEADGCNLCECVLFKRRKLCKFMHCTLYTYQAKQRIFQNKNISLLSYFSEIHKNALMPTHNFGILHVFCFEGCCRFYNNYSAPSLQNY